MKRFAIFALRFAFNLLHIVRIILRLGNCMQATCLCRRVVVTFTAAACLHLISYRDLLKALARYYVSALF